MCMVFKEWNSVRKLYLSKFMMGVLSSVEGRDGNNIWHIKKDHENNVSQEEWTNGTYLSS